MCERDMMYGGYYQNIPGNIAYGNFGYQGMPGSLLPMQNNMIGSIPNTDQIQNNMITNNNPLLELNTRLNNLEQRVKRIEQRLNTTNDYQDDNSMYMI